jgi:hypothetical protein
MSERKKQPFPVFVIKDGEIADLIFRDPKTETSFRSPTHLADSADQSSEKDHLSLLGPHQLHPRPL